MNAPGGERDEELSNTMARFQKLKRRKEREKEMGMERERQRSLELERAETAKEREKERERERERKSNPGKEEPNKISSFVSRHIGASQHISDQELLMGQGFDNLADSFDDSDDDDGAIDWASMRAAVDKDMGMSSYN